MVQIHLSVKKKDKKKKGEKKPKKEKKEGEELGPEGEIPVEDEEDEDKNRVVYSPSPEECRSFILGSMDMIISSTNNVNNLESDLMPFLAKEGKSNFPITP